MVALNLYSLILATGASFGLLRLALAVPSGQRLDWLLAGLLALFGALVGARAGFVLEYLPFFKLHTAQSYQFWLGGLTWPGALAGALLFIFLAAKIWRWPFTSVFNKISLLVLPLSVTAWLAAWSTGSAYGQNLPAGAWWGLRMADESGQFSLRNPVQPLAALSLLVFLGFFEFILLKDKFPPWRGSLVLTIFSADMLLFSFLRADPAQTWLGFRFETWAAMVYTLAGAAVLLVMLFRSEFFHSYQNRLKLKRKQEETA